ncbi:MAG: antibiotic biosynthesis monooxygenase family protein [Dongiaceae bacterium]
MTQFGRIRQALIAAVILLVAGGFHAAYGADQVAFEVVISKPKAGVSLEALLQADKTMEQEFVAKQKGFIDREVGVGKDGEVLVIVRWATIEDAEAAGALFMNDPFAKARAEMSDLSLFKHYIKQ